MPKPLLEILGGPNGSGKSTLAEVILQKRGPLFYINADTIAKGMNAASATGGAIEAARVMLHAIHSALDAGESFAFETTLAGKSWTALLRSVRSKGYEIVLYYVMLKNVDLAIERVARRVALGGHRIPENVLRRRFTRSKDQFTKSYRQLADKWFVFDNSSPSAQLIARKENGGIVVLNDIFYEIFPNVTD